MDNKLSELSKPVAWAFKDANDVEHASITKKANLYGRHDFQPLYSQEYVSALLAELAAKDKRIAELEDDKRQLNEIINSEANRANAAEKRITEMEFNELNLIAERDNAENVVTNMYRAATGDSPEWSNWFGFADAIEEVAQIRAKLATPVRLPEGLAQKIKVTGYYESLNEMMDCVRAAGFKCVGDE